MNEFELYFHLGMSHIADLGAYDHILFIVALCAMYRLKDWRQLLYLVTAFTLGHSITLALATLGILPFRPEVVEFLIPLSILLTALYNVSLGNRGEGAKAQSLRMKYSLAAGFGLIHGMGFSNYLRSLLGEAENIVQPLLAFNLGLELGQLLIVAILLAFSEGIIRASKWSPAQWNFFTSGAAAGIALILLTETTFW